MAFNNNKGEVDFPFEIKPLDPELNSELLRQFTGERTNYVQVGEKKWFYPGKFKETANHYYNFEARPDDVWVATFPRSGTTWVQELVWMIANDLDYEAAQRQLLTKRFPFFEFAVFMHDKIKEELMEINKGYPEKQAIIEQMSRHGYEFFPEMTTRRFIKTHFPFSLLPPSVMETGAKVIYVVRDPRDVAVSFYHLNRLYKTQGFRGDFPTYWNYFEKGLSAWTPYWSHIEEACANRHHPNVLFMRYEDINKDMPSTIRKVAAFLGKQMTDEQVHKLADYLHIDNFRNNKAVNCEELKAIGIFYEGEQEFVRKGKCNGWSEEFTPELKKRAEKWIEENSKKINFYFPL